MMCDFACWKSITPNADIKHSEHAINQYGVMGYWTPGIFLARLFCTQDVAKRQFHAPLQEVSREVSALSFYMRDLSTEAKVVNPDIV